MIVKIAAWNIRGMTDTSKHDEVKSLISENGISMCGVIETRLNKKIANNVCKDVFGNWYWENNSVDCIRGCRIAVTWDPGVLDAVLVSKSDQVMHFLVTDILSSKSFYVSFIYAENDPKDRLVLWKNLVDHMAVIGDSSWVMLGDFNVSLYAEESTKPGIQRDFGIQDFRECMEACNMEDLPMEGIFYTWIQKRNNPECGIMKKLDRVMGNCHFMDDFKACIATFLPFVTSDHSPAVLSISDLTVKKSKTFRFMNYLADKAEFLDVVKKNWNVPVKGFSMFVLAKRLKLMKRHMRSLNRKNGNVFDKVKRLKAELKKVQMDLDKDPDNPLLREEELIYNFAYREALLDEEKVLKQKSKIEWLKEGDQNNSYFHNFIKGRFSKSRIDSVYDEEGVKYSGSDVSKKFVEHFHGFFGKDDDDIYPVEDPESLFTKKISEVDAVYMIRPIMDEEIKAAIFDIEDNKAPGPDGFTSKFFKASWNIIGDDVCRAVKEFFTSGKLLGELNNTIISLVPKIKNPSKVTDYRPIACSGVVYTGISKVITNRIKGSLGKLIDCNQSAFIEGRQISDNILLIQELMNGYNWSNRARRCAFKVDIQKAYDTVSWSFLKFALENFGFHATMIKWIMVCLATASFSIKVNDEVHGFFKAKRGLRQGDPVSPYLFTIIMEVLNLMIKRQIRLDNRFKYH